MADMTTHAASADGRGTAKIVQTAADDLPTTRSGKIMRRSLRDIAERRDVDDVTTLADPSILRGLQEQAAARGNTTG